MILFNGLQRLEQIKYMKKDWNSTKNRPRVMEYSGFLILIRKGLEKAIVDDRALALDEEEATDYNSYHVILLKLMIIMMTLNIIFILIQECAGAAQ